MLMLLPTVLRYSVFVTSIGLAVRCRTVDSVSSQSLPQNSYPHDIMNRLRSPMAQSEAQDLLRLLHRSSLSGEHLNEALALTMDPLHPRPTILPVIQALKARNADINHAMTSSISVGDKVVTAAEWEDDGPNESYACAVANEYADGVLEVDSRIFEYRAYIFSGPGAHFDPDYLEKNVLKCEEHLRAPGLKTYAEDFVSEYCAGKEPMDIPEPTCPAGWTPFHNRLDEDVGEYRTGCEREQTEDYSLRIPQADVDYVHSQCSGSVSRGSRYEEITISCSSPQPLAPVNCPSGYQKSSYVEEENSRFFAEDAENQLPSPPHYVVECARTDVYRKPQEMVEPHASRLAAMRAELQKRQGDFQVMLAKLQDAGADLDRPCRMRKNFQRFLGQFAKTFGIPRRDTMPAPRAITSVTARGEREIGTSQVLRVKMGSGDWILKATIRGRCAVSIVAMAVKEAIERLERVGGNASGEHIYLGDASHRCGLHSVRGVGVSNNERIIGLLKESVENVQAMPVMNKDEALRFFD